MSNEIRTRAIAGSVAMRVHNLDLIKVRVMDAVLTRIEVDGLTDPDRFTFADDEPGATETGRAYRRGWRDCLYSGDAVSAVLGRVALALQKLDGEIARIEAGLDEVVQNAAETGPHPKFDTGDL